jgi:hypothetical protein
MGSQQAMRSAWMCWAGKGRPLLPSAQQAGAKAGDGSTGAIIRCAGLWGSLAAASP